MDPKWHFNQRRACDRMRDSANDAFFTAESLENLSEALVREGIQNSLDAARRTEGHVRQVRVSIRFEASGTPEIRRYLKDLFEPSKQNFERGLTCPDLSKLFGSDCGYLVFEDFGTKGLTGNADEWRLELAQQNAFFSFFRAEGSSSKSGESLGRWGIGKQVFPTASRLHAILGLTVRDESPRRVLMGSAVVRTHTVDGQDFQPDAWFGLRDNENDPVSPVTDSHFIETFIKTFGLKRGNEAGLSIVVPSADDRVNIDDLRRGIIRSFFWPILQGELTVELESMGKVFQIDSETLAAHRPLLPANESAVLEFAVWASTAKPLEIVSLPAGTAVRPDWRANVESILPEQKLVEIRTRLEECRRVGVKVPVRVRPKFEGGREGDSYFTIYLEVCRDLGYRPIFLRDGIVITDVRCPQMSGHRSLVVVEERSLAGLLGDSEGVNHTQWQKDSPKFHNRYVYGADTIKFVSRSVYEIMQRLHAAETKGDPKLLMDIFYLPTDYGDPEQIKKPKPQQPGPVVEEPPPLPPSRPRSFVLDSVKGGFVLRPGGTPIKDLPIRVRIEAGYGVRRGNAIKRWSNDDFAFVRPPLRQELAKGVVVSRSEGNSLELEIKLPDFQFGISGFDTRRDLVVRAIELRANNETDV